MAELVEHVTVADEALEAAREARTEANFLAIGYVQDSNGRWVPPEEQHG